MTTTLRLSDVATGSPRAPTLYDFETRRAVPQDPRAVFLERFDGDGLAEGDFLWPEFGSIVHRVG